METVSRELQDAKEPYLSALKRQFYYGQFGRYTPQSFQSPETENGLGIYEMVLKSCTVIFQIVTIWNHWTLKN